MMPSLTCFKFQFTPSWPMSILAILFFSLFVRLGFWQIHRADEKTKMIVAQKTQEKQKPVPWSGTKTLPVQYERISLKGHYLSQVFLLDNQHHKHQFGYDVLSPLQLPDGSIIVIDRGWVPGELTRRILPNIQIPKGSIELQGIAYFPSKNQWVLGPALEEKGNKMIILERVDDQLFSQVLQKSVAPFIIRLDKQDTNGFVREWETVSMPPQRHLAYALQWFAMALVILIIFVALNLKKKNEKTSQ
ncbi:SURF1 family protein [Legionella qingyii]|uniref:SURF1-like protein n=2 Tax=Legionella qingyii TaxID=2184757 RepID=A0A317U4P2_9GAMM|nr:SURF1 family protein [Legionella qingyii]RUR24424.1 SURF1 family protein [Legionella qingyii]RUR27073.1 SURF1 family protein [Legionella qingyii]